MKTKGQPGRLQKFSFAIIIMAGLASTSYSTADPMPSEDKNHTFNSMTDFIDYVKNNSYSAFLKPFYIEGINPYDVADERVSIFWNTKVQTKSASKVFKEWFKYESLSDGYDASANYFQAKTTKTKDRYIDNSIIVINKEIPKSKIDILRPMGLFPELSKAYPKFFPTKNTLEESLHVFLENYAHYLLLHELAHGSHYQDMIYLDAKDIPKELYEYASEMHSDLTAIMTIISGSDFDQTKALDLIDGIIAWRAVALVYSDDEITFAHDAVHASMGGMIILRNLIEDDPDFIYGVSHFLINTIAGDITQVSVVPSKIKKLDLIKESASIDSVDTYIKTLTRFKNQANNLSKHVFGIKPTHTPDINPTL